METIKSVIGLGKGTQEGQEPISGETGAGTAVEPYDQGNKEDDSALGGKPPQDPETAAEKSPTEPITADQPTASGKSEEHIEPNPTAATNSTSTNSISETPTKEASSGDTANEKPSIGSPSWFKTAIPFSKRKEDGGEATSTSIATTDNIHETAAPNQSGDNVTSGHSTNEAAVANMADTHPNVAAPNASEDPMARAADGEAQSAARDVPQLNVSNGYSPPNDRRGEMFSNPFNKNEGVGMSTADKRRLSREAYGSNPNAIPTAGGIRIGSVQYERRMSQAPRKSMEQPKIDEALTESTNQSYSNSAIADDEEPKPKDSGVGATPTSPTQASKKSTDETRRSMSKGSAGGSEKKKRGLLGKLKDKLDH